MDLIAIPAEALNSPEYEKLTLADKYFLIELYRINGDCQRFTIDSDRPAVYRQPPSVNLCRKINKLIDSGLIKAIDLQKNGTNHYQRVFAFRYSPLGELQAA
jgi:hypothetical protein